MPTDKTLVTVATYNEMENLPRLVEEILRHAPEADILVIDDNSPDGTGRWCDQQGAENPRIHCLHRPGKLGLGTATIAGMKYAIEHGYRYVLNMDADFSHQPKHVPALLAGMDPPGGPPVDVMIGSRYTAGGGVEGWPLKRQLMSRARESLRPHAAGPKAERLQWGVPLLSRGLAGKARFQRRPQPRLLVPGRDPRRLKRLGARFGETPIIFLERQHGVSKIDSGEALSAVRIIFALGLRNWLCC